MGFCLTLYIQTATCPRLRLPLLSFLPLFLTLQVPSYQAYTARQSLTDHPYKTTRKTNTFVNIKLYVLRGAREVVRPNATTRFQLNGFS